VTGSPRNVEAGQALRAERERLGLSTRDVERLSFEIAESKHNREYYTSHTWIHGIEAGKLKPNLFKIYTLCVLYKRTLDEILSLFGIDMETASRDQSLVGLPNTHLVIPGAERRAASVLAPMQLRDQADIERTNLVSRMFAGWSEIPVTLLQKMDLQRSLYGYVGTTDYTLYPLIRPGSFVQIDARQTKIVSNWKSEFDRPIYFLELREGYACSWCELHGGQLILLPTPQSGARARHVRYPGDAGILGRVTAVTMPIVSAQPDARKKIVPVADG
jgi:transcriptional regulator with XRE-family HTH domain